MQLRHRGGGRPPISRSGGRAPGWVGSGWLSARRQRLVRRRPGAIEHALGRAGRAAGRRGSDAPWQRKGGGIDATIRSRHNACSVARPGKRTCPASRYIVQLARRCTTLGVTLDRVPDKLSRSILDAVASYPSSREVLPNDAPQPGIFAYLRTFERSHYIYVVLAKCPPQIREAPRAHGQRAHHLPGPCAAQKLRALKVRQRRCRQSCRVRSVLRCGGLPRHAFDPPARCKAFRPRPYVCASDARVVRAPRWYKSDESSRPVDAAHRCCFVLKMGAAYHAPTA